jgi:hypothetical protein
MEPATYISTDIGFTALLYSNEWLLVCLGLTKEDILRARYSTVHERLPRLSNDGNLPVLLSAEELRRLFFAAQRMKRRGRPSPRMFANPNFEVRGMEKHIANVGGCRESVG